MISHIEKGKQGEQLAADFLVAAGYEIIERNYRYGHGEIDIIANDGDYLVFVEVKSRSNESYGAPAYAVTRSKQRQMSKIAQGYMYEHQLSATACRFDVITVEFITSDPVLEHIPNAFTVMPY
jgi:putative endonuclease